MAKFLLILLVGTFSWADEIQDAEKFFSWLEESKSKFAQCEPTAKGDEYQLCDGTAVNRERLKSLFKLPATKLVDDLKTQGIKLEILCDKSKSAKDEFDSWCQTQTSRKVFEKITPLHGQYLPTEKTILLRSSASKGSMIHEYLHHLQYTNSERIYGHIYKKERVEIQNRLTKVMDEIIAKAQEYEQKGEAAKVQPLLERFMKANNLMRKFAFWQDLIDERSLFLLYRKYGKEFGASKEDLALAEKNMGFICNNTELKAVLPKKQCM